MVARERQKCLVSDFCSPCQIRSSIVTNLLLINQTALEFQSITRETHFNPIFKDLEKKLFIFFIWEVSRDYTRYGYFENFWRGVLFLSFYCILPNFGFAQLLKNVSRHRLFFSRNHFSSRWKMVRCFGPLEQLIFQFFECFLSRPLGVATRKNKKSYFFAFSHSFNLSRPLWIF